MLNPNEAPEGYIATLSPTGLCNGCVFFHPTSSSRVCRKRKRTDPCITEGREDRCNVIFIVDNSEEESIHE